MIIFLKGEGDGSGSLGLTSILQQADIPLRSDCSEVYKKVLIKPEKQMCAGAKNVDSCGGDSGGPLLVRYSIITSKFLLTICEIQIA